MKKSKCKECSAIFILTQKSKKYCTNKCYKKSKGRRYRQLHAKKIVEN